MGIKPSYIKNLGTALLAKQKESFFEQFRCEQAALSASASIDSKRVRNRVPAI